MPRVAIPRSQRAAQLLRARRHELGLTLRDVEKRTASLGAVIPFSTIARIESGKVDPGVLRFQQLLRLYDLTPEVAAELLDLELAGDDALTETPPKKLYQLATRAHENGDYHKAASYLLALRGRADESPDGRTDRHRATIALAVTAGRMGKYHLAKQLVEQVLTEPVDARLMVCALVQLAVSWFRLGSSDLALAILTGAEAELRPTDARDRGMIDHQRACILRAAGQLDAAMEAIDRATRNFRKAGDAFAEANAECARVSILLDAGRLAEALAAAERGLQSGIKQGARQVVLSRRIDRGRVLRAMGRREEALAELNQAFAEAVAADDRPSQFYAQYYLWKSYGDAGERARADAALAAAGYFVQFVDIVDDEAQEIRHLRGIPAVAAPSRPRRRRGRRP